jgi:hypothetical protein
MLAIEVVAEGMENHKGSFPNGVGGGRRWDTADNEKIRRPLAVSNGG